MLHEVQGKTVLVYLHVSPLGENRVKGEVVQIDNSWLKLRTKKTMEWIKIDAIKKITMKHLIS